jgi:lysophospholipase L1-like esterase
MKRFVSKVFVAAIIAACPLISRAEELKSGDLVAVIGDSITEQKDYSVNIEDYLLACQPKPDLKAMQFGWGGETAGGFKSRMDNDTFRYHPTVATTCYGMNDGGYSPMDPNKAKGYHDNQLAIVKGMKKAGVRFIVVGSPGCVDSTTFRQNPVLATMYNKTLAEERDLSKQVAEAEGVTFADVYDPMIDVMAKAKAKYGPQYHLAGGDGVHPSRNGHLVMAYAYLKALGCDGNIGTITVDFQSGDAKATDGHKVLSSGRGSVEIESSRYPFCFAPGNANDPNCQRGILEFLPFNQDLNRFMLVVQNGPEKAKITWGTQSREFTKAELDKGINLADAFLDNPFSKPFEAIHQVVQQQQNLETPMIKTWVHGLPQFKSDMPEDAECFDKIVADMGKKDEKLSAAARGKATPVKHTIKIEAAN